MAVEFSATARRLGILSAVSVVVVEVAYAVTLVVGFLSLQSPQQPIGDPMFSILEVLIIVMMPVMVMLMVAVHAWAPSHAKALSLSAVVFMGLLAAVTSSVHASGLLALARCMSPATTPLKPYGTSASSVTWECFWLSQRYWRSCSIAPDPRRADDEKARLARRICHLQSGW
ncbi:MAG TPA: hypothetical protein VF980_06230 [Thermoanaerobaculia bacterium]